MQRDTIERLFYGEPEHQRRFTQDFPILPDVWIEYGKNPAGRVELLLTPHNESDSATLARALRQRLADEPQAAGPSSARVLYNESVVLAALTFPQLLRAALPLSAWWERAVTPAGPTWTRAALQQFASDLAAFVPGARVLSTDPRLLQKLIRIAGVIELERAGRATGDVGVNPSPTPEEIQAFAAVFDGLPTVAEGSGLMWSVSLNRRASASVWRSRLTVKADAAGRLFDARSTGIRWAVLDTGIDATHPAFARRGPPGRSKPQAGAGDTIESRVLKTYDFLRIKTLLDPDAEIAADGSAAATLPAETLREQREQLRNSLRRGRAIDWDLLEPFLRVPHTREHYRPPQHDGHGTHVAGILAANWPEATESTPLGEPLMGVCPDIELYDLRVLPDDPNDRADEFTVIAALQFIRHLNAHKDLMVVHGVNLSLSVPHDVANYACGLYAGLRGMRTRGRLGRRGRGGGRQPRLQQVGGSRRRSARRLSLHQHHRSRQCGRRHHRGLDAPDDAAQLRRVLFLEPRPYRRRPHQARPRGAGRAHRIMRAERLRRNHGRDQHGRAARQRRRGTAHEPSPRADRPAAPDQGHPVPHRHRSRPRAALPGGGDRRRITRHSVRLTHATHH